MNKQTRYLLNKYDCKERTQKEQEFYVLKHYLLEEKRDNNNKINITPTYPATY